MHPSMIYGHTDDLDMMLFITVGLWFGLRVVLEPLSADIAITLSASGYPGVVFCPVRDCRSGHFPFFRRNGWKFWAPLIFNGFHTRFRGCPANAMSAAMLWKVKLCFLSIVVRVAFEQNTKSC